MKDSSLQKHLWLIDTVFQAGNEGISYEEINHKWKTNAMSQGKYYPLRTFHNHRKEIEEVFHIAIVCRKSTNRYYINHQNSGISQKLFELISLQQFIKKGRLNPARFRMAESAACNFSLTTILQAIQDQQYLNIAYHDYAQDKTLTLNTFAPYAVKEFRQRWHLLGRTTKDEQYHFLELRQIESITPINEHYTTVPEEEINAILDENYGCMIEDIPCAEITVKVDRDCANFLHYNPLHSSQQEIERKSNYAIFYYYLRPTQCFIREIIAFGSGVEILSPITLRKEVAKEAKRIERKNC